MGQKADTEGRCGRASKLLFPCSGGTGAAHIAEAARLASMILAIDGCAAEGAKSTLKDVGLKRIRHIRVTDLDLVKGKNAVTRVRIRKPVEKAKEKLAS